MNLIFVRYIERRSIKMDTNEEKKLIYEQLKLIIAERRRLSELYYEWKQKLEELNRSINENTNSSKKNRLDLKIESEYQNYMHQRKANHFNSYQDISLTIVSILKEAGIPLSNTEILKRIIEKKGSIINNSNLTCNILPRMNKDNKIPVERVCRGYWQYRLH